MVFCSTPKNKLKKGGLTLPSSHKPETLKPKGCKPAPKLEPYHLSPYTFTQRSCSTKP